MKALIDVTDEDIQSGLRGDCRNCPVARAIKRVLPGTSIDVGAKDLMIYRGKNILTIPLPKIVIDFVHSFDGYGQCYPVSFELEIPE